MEISKLLLNIEELVKRVETHKQAQKDSFGLSDEAAHTLLSYVVQYKHWKTLEANHPKDANLQKLPLDYYQVSARQQLWNYERQVEVGVPRLLALGIVDKEGNLL